MIAATVASFIGLLAMGVPLLSQVGQRGALYRALGLLTTASPCALVLVPLAYVSAIAAVTNRQGAAACPRSCSVCPLEAAEVTLDGAEAFSLKEAGCWMRWCSARPLLLIKRER